MYLVLTKCSQIYGGVEVSWEVFNDLEAAKVMLARVKRQSDELEKVSMDNMLPPLGPRLAQSIILKVEEAQC